MFNTMLFQNYLDSVENIHLVNISKIVDCAEPYPVLNNGIISDRTFGPISATYSCSPGFTGVGQGNRITCRPGGQWSPLSYSCEPPGKTV